MDIEKIVTNFTKNIIDAAKHTIEYSKPNTKKPQIPWWNNEIKQYIALKTFTKTRSLEDHTKLKKLRAKTRFLVKNNKTLI